MFPDRTLTTNEMTMIAGSCKTSRVDEAKLQENHDPQKEVLKMNVMEEKVWNLDNSDLEKKYKQNIDSISKPKVGAACQSEEIQNVDTHRMFG